MPGWLFLACAVFQPADPAIEALLREKLAGIDPARQARYALVLGRALEAAPSAERRGLVLRELGDALEYHALSAGRHPLVVPEVKADGPFMDEGLDLQMEYLAARVARAGRTEATTADRARMESQIDAVSGSIADVLREKLRGEAAASWIDREVGRLREGWRDTLDSPLQAFLDRPLTEEALAAVLSGVEEVARLHPVLTLTPEELADEAVLRKKGVLSLLARLREAAYEASAACFAEFETLERRTREWDEECRRRAGLARQGKLTAETPPRILDRGRLVRGSPPGKADATSSGEPAPASSDAVQDKKPVSEGSFRSGLAWILAAGATLAAVGILWTRRAKSA